MNIDKPQNRLKKFWGKVDQKHIKLISDRIKGKKILDMGAGYGTTSSYLTQMGYEVTAIDLDEDSIKIAKDLDPQINYLKVNAESLPFKKQSFDTIVLRDALHHFYGESDFEKVKSEIIRVLKPKGVLIFFDPNVNFLIRLLRKISNHQDEECSFTDAKKIMNGLNFKITHQSFNTIISLPLSGGYVGRNFVPQINFIQSLILQVERFLEYIVQNRIGQQIAWRYLIVGENKN
jgi:2-polyprenyl-3-methyl-5-hydroxy-6-metoxy-1,4-benzoquinol methylase